jgi:hypothetical protein
MVSVNVSSKFKSLYRYATGRIQRPLAPQSERNRLSVETGDSFLPEAPVSLEMPLEQTRIMRPGKRALQFTGTSLISAESETLDDGTHYKLDIFQRADEQFIMRLNKVDAYGTLRLLLTSEAAHVNDLETILNQVDAGKFVSFLPSIDSSSQNSSNKTIYIELNDRLSCARSQYSAFIGSIFADTAANEGMKQ